jgi:hypothetical protein
MTDTADPQRGDVVNVDYANEDKAAAAKAARAAGTDPLRAPAPAAAERIKIRLHGHPMTYLVRVNTGMSTGPVITELAVIADDGHAVDYAAVRAIPVRRLAYSAAWWIDRAGGQLRFPGDYSEHRTRPEIAAAKPNERLGELAWRIEHAIMNNEPVRPTVAREMHVSTSTLDRMIAKARAEGLLEGIELPRRPSPQQRDALIARHEREMWLDEHGPYETPPPEFMERQSRLLGHVGQDDPTTTTTEDDR